MRTKTNYGAFEENAGFTADQYASPINSQKELEHFDTSSYHQLKGSGDEHGSSSTDPNDEPAWKIFLQVFFPFLVAGMGMVGAGYLLSIVQSWDVYVNVSEVFILVPALLGLKGNIEMTLASRLSTQANMGTMDDKNSQMKTIGGNLCLTQGQAIVVGFLAALFAIIFGYIKSYISGDGNFEIHEAVLLAASSCFTAWFASLVLGLIMIGVVTCSRVCHINPDNVATPIAASLGDIVTLSILSISASLLWDVYENGNVWLSPVILGVLLLLTPLFIWLAWRNPYTKDATCTGWSPVIGAMAIDTAGGVILDFAVKEFKGLAAFQPLINGVGGNLTAVQASRLSTALHLQGEPGTLPKDQDVKCANPCKTFFGKGIDARTARVLLLMVVPGHIIFIYLESLIEHHLPSILFLVLFLVAALLQVAMLLYLANWLVRFFWSWKCDPDNYAIPYLTALADLIGTGFIAVVFYILTVTPYEFTGFEEVGDSAVNLTTTAEPLLSSIGL